MARSNGLFLPYLPTPPLPGQGWLVKVISCDDLQAYCDNQPVEPLAVIRRFTELVISPEIGDVGAGSITIALTDSLWTRPLNDGSDPLELRIRPHLFVVYEDGKVRGEFFRQKVDETLLDSGELAGMQVTISGPGGGGVLDWAKVFSPYYPNTPPKDKLAFYRFTDKPVMACWKALLYAAQRRGTIPYFHAMFDAVRDTGKEVWQDTPKKINNTGSALLGDVLFEYDSYALTAAGRDAVKAVSAKVAKVTYPTIDVVGHTDSTGSADYNYQLGLQRAQAVADVLREDYPGAVMTVSSKGETQPIATNSTSAGRAKNRRVRVTYQLNPTSQLHTVYEPGVGSTLLQLLRDLTGGEISADRGPLFVEWTVWPKMRLHVRRRIGRDRSAYVQYHEGSTAMISKGRSRDSSRVANLIAVQSDLTGEYAVKSDSTSRARWGQREFFQRLDGSTYTKDVRSRIAATHLQLLKDEDDSWTLTVTVGRGRRPFIDFTLGDTIGLVRLNGTAASTVDKHRVMAISVRVDSDGQPSYELRLQSNRASRLKALQARLDALTVRREGVRTFFSDDQPTGAAVGDFWTPPAPPAT